MKRIALILISILLAVAAFGCSSKNSYAAHSYTSDAYDGGYYAYDEPGEYYESPVIAENAMDNSIAASNGATIPANRKIIRNADISVQTLEFDAFMDKLNEQIAAFGGYVESSSEGGRTYYNQSKLRTAYITVRVPASQLDAFLNTVDGLGNVISKSTGMRDVTTTYIDSEKHLEALRAEQEALLEILKSATTVEDIITVQDRLSYVRYEIESYESILRSYDDQIDYSSVNINISEVERETVVEPETFGQEVARRFQESLEDVGESFRDFGAWFLGNAPQITVFFVFNGLIALIVFLIVRGSIKRSRKRRAAKEAAKAAQKEA